MAKKQGPEWNAEPDATIDAFSQWKRYRELTPEILEAIPDAELELAILDFICDQVQATGRREREVLSRLSPGFRAVYTTWWVGAEVNNGGFNQYFWNSAGQFAADAVDGFELIGVPVIARLMERAIAIRDEDEERTQMFKDRGTLEAFSESYEGNRLNDLDREFFKLAASAAKARIRFIRENPDLFRGWCDAGPVTLH